MLPRVGSGVTVGCSTESQAGKTQGALVSEESCQRGPKTIEENSPWLHRSEISTNQGSQGIHPEVGNKPGG